MRYCTRSAANCGAAIAVMNSIRTSACDEKEQGTALTGSAEFGTSLYALCAEAYSVSYIGRADAHASPHVGCAEGHAIPHVACVEGYAVSHTSSATV
jgi:hypothetical protein